MTAVDYGLDVERSNIAAGRGKWSAADPTPKFGWRRVLVSRRNEELTPCEMCGTRIRYEHHMRHPEGIDLVAGCICSGYMTLAGHYRIVDQEERDRALAEAIEVEKNVEKAERRVRTLDRVMAKDALALAEIQASLPRYASDVLRDPVIKTWLEKLRERAHKREGEMLALEGAYLHLIGTPVAHIAQTTRVDDAIAEARRHEKLARGRERATELSGYLAAPDWVPTPKGLRSYSPHGDSMQVFRNPDGKIKAFYQLNGQDKKWGRYVYPDFASAQSQVLKSISGALRKASRLPRTQTAPDASSRGSSPTWEL